MMEKIEKRWKVSRIIEVNAEAIPEWARCLGFGLYGRPQTKGIIENHSTN